ncbi:hypothetical protein [Streptomyces sp. NPDC059071]
MDESKGKKPYKKLLVLAAIIVMVALLKGAAAEAGADLYKVIRNTYS